MYSPSTIVKIVTKQLIFLYVAKPMAMFLPSTLAASVVNGRFCDFIHEAVLLPSVWVSRPLDMNDVDLTSFVKEYVVVVGQLPVWIRIVSV